MRTAQGHYIFGQQTIWVTDIWATRVRHLATCLGCLGNEILCSKKQPFSLLNNSVRNELIFTEQCCVIKISAVFVMALCGTRSKILTQVGYI